jgi:ribosomal protein S18 acetylase RimI-like enzyme
LYLETERNHSIKHAVDAAVTSQIGAMASGHGMRTYCLNVQCGSQLQIEAPMLLITEALAEPEISQARTLFQEYAMTPGVVACLQDFESEVASLPGQYGPPTGRLLLALHRSPGESDEPIGCVGLRKLEKEICEMKRLYVRPGFRKEGTGQALVENIIADASAMGYMKMRLDTLPIMRQAQGLYRRLGFVEIPPYLKIPTPNALCFELALSQG